MKKMILTCLICSFSVLGFSTHIPDNESKIEKPALYKRALIEYKLYRFSEAAKLFQDYYSIVKDQSNKANAAYLIGMSYSNMNQYSKAENWFEKSVKNKVSDPDVYFQLAECQKKQGNFESAIKNYKNYVLENPSDSGVEILISYCDSAIIWQITPNELQIEPAKALNSKNNDYCPAYFKDNAIVFTSDREIDKRKAMYLWTGLPFTDIYVSSWDKKKNTLTEPLVFPELNTAYNEGVVSFNKNFNEVYFTQCNGPEGKLHNCRIMYSKLKGSIWSEPEVMPFCIDSFIHYSHPSLSTDGKKLYFTSNMIGGFGEKSERGDFLTTTDIWMCIKSGRSKSWSDPVNLGSSINTNSNEQFPFIFQNNKLYFSSDRKNGIGGFDIFVSEKKEESWSEPENLKCQINSYADDFGIIIKEGSSIYKGMEGYISSDRNLSKGDDIYHFYSPPIKVSLEGIVYNKKTGKPEPDATVILNNSTTDSSIQILSDEKGHYSFDPIEFENLYSVHSEKENFYESSKKELSTIGLKTSKHFIRDLEIEPFDIEIAVVLEGIFFELDSSRITKESALILDSLAKSLKKYPFLIIELGSHTDCRASWDYNIELSWKRANSCMNYLIDKGISTDRLIPRGYGESDLVNECECENDSGKGINCSEAEHSINRRTTIKILRTDYKPVSNN